MTCKLSCGSLTLYISSCHCAHALWLKQCLCAAQVEVYATLPPDGFPSRARQLFYLHSRYVQGGPLAKHANALFQVRSLC